MTITYYKNHKKNNNKKLLCELEYMPKKVISILFNVTKMINNRQKHID